MGFIYLIISSFVWGFPAIMVAVGILSTWFIFHIHYLDKSN